jgi:ribosomal-protein-alanine N-acetyltransferase
VRAAASEPYWRAMNTGFFARFPTLETPRLILRELALSDAEDILALHADEEVRRYQGIETMAGLEQACAHVARAHKRFRLEAGVSWAIISRADGTLAGTCTYAHFVPVLDRGHITYQLARRAWGRGFGTEAVRALVAFGHGVAALNRIEAVVVPENQASVRVLRKAGFEDEGLLRGYGRWRGRYHDLRMFGLVREG